jgi:hypothetical protein
MQNPKHIVIKPTTHTVTTDDGSFTTPTIPGAHNYSNAVEWIIAYGPAANRRHRSLAMCRKIKSDTWLIIADQPVIDQIDPEGKGKTVEQSGQQWPIWRYDGDIPSTDPEAKPGDRETVKSKPIVFFNIVPDMTSASLLSVVTIEGDCKVSRAWPSLDAGIAGHDLRAIVEPKE